MAEEDNRCEGCRSTAQDDMRAAERSDGAIDHGDGLGRGGRRGREASVRWGRWPYLKASGPISGRRRRSMETGDQEASETDEDTFVGRAHADEAGFELSRPRVEHRTAIAPVWVEAAKKLEPLAHHDRGLPAAPGCNEFPLDATQDAALGVARSPAVLAFVRSRGGRTRPRPEEFQLALQHPPARGPRMAPILRSPLKQFDIEPEIGVSQILGGIGDVGIEHDAAHKQRGGVGRGARQRVEGGLLVTHKEVLRRVPGRVTDSSVQRRFVPGFCRCKRRW